jgi:hypothetical protein
MILICFHLFFIRNVADAVTKGTERNNDKDETVTRIFVVVYIHIPATLLAS